MALSAQVQQRDGKSSIVQLVGSIDEGASLDTVLEVIKGDATLNLSRVQSVNSIGLLRWVQAFVPMTQRHALSVEAVPYCFVIQANLVSDIFGRAALLSCLAPYYCPSCGVSREVLVTAADVKAAQDKAPTKACPTCKSTMDFDEMDGYFAFLRVPA